MAIETALVGTVSLVVGSMMTAIGYLFKENKALRESEAKCQRDMAAMRSDLLSLNALVEQMRWNGPQTIDALIVANMLNGLIVEWNPGATLLFHWMSREMLGKSISKIMPERYRPIHDRIINNVQFNSMPPRRGPIFAHGVSKDGNEFPITIFLSGWRDGATPMVAATISRRLESADGKSPDS